MSSEQRRRLQQEHPKASSRDLDDMLRSKWDKLTDKEKVRYYQRAWTAVSDRERTVLHADGTFIHCGLKTRLSQFWHMT